MWTSRMKLWTFMCTSKIVRERERETSLGELIRDVDHPLREHELPGEPFTSFGAFQFRGVANVELFSESEGSGSGSEWRLRKEAKQQAWCWLSWRFCAWCCRESSLCLCWSEIAARLNGWWSLCGAILFCFHSSTFVREPLLSLFLLIWKVKETVVLLVIVPALFCCRSRAFSNSSTSNCTSDVMLLCRFSKNFPFL